MAPSQELIGGAPLTFTDHLGVQRSLPLAALRFDGKTVTFADAAWDPHFDAADRAILSALVKSRVATGELAPPPVVPPVPALSFAAATPGPEGNNVSVTVAPSVAGSLFDLRFKISAKEVDSYSLLADADAAAHAIGVDTPGGGVNPPPAGSGLVVVQAASVAAGSVLPKDGQSLTVKNATAVVADDSSTLFKIAPRAGYSGAGIDVKITVSADKKTFSLVATCDAGTTGDLGVADLAALPAAQAFLITASAPPGGFAPPAAATVQLTGGSRGIAATGTVYTG